MKGSFFSVQKLLLSSNYEKYTLFFGLLKIARFSLCLSVPIFLSVFFIFLLICLYFSLLPSLQVTALLLLLILYIIFLCFCFFICFHISLCFYCFLCYCFFSIIKLHFNQYEIFTFKRIFGKKLIQSCGEKVEKAEKKRKLIPK